jgi:hypothetical protein
MRPLLPALASLFLLACSAGSDPAAAPASLDPSDPGKADVDSSTACEVTFRWLQKDAYANRAGRTSELWPPHTTTVIDVACRGMEPYSKFRANHGTAPGDVDAAGTPILVEVKRSPPVRASRPRTLDLLTAYQACECEPTTAFLSTSAVDQGKGQALLASLAGYLQAHLSCPDLDVAQLAASVQKGEFDRVLEAVSSCTWDTGEGWAAGFETASKTVLGADFANYHVCNNDAQLEAALFDTFASGAPIQACGDSPLCHGPKWFYTP